MTAKLKLYWVLVVVLFALNVYAAYLSCELSRIQDRTEQLRVNLQELKRGR